jgi:outer membrane receptor for ferrienterochelin and colicins
MKSHLIVPGLSIALCNSAWTQSVKSAAPSAVIADTVRLCDVVITWQHVPQSLFCLCGTAAPYFPGFSFNRNSNK